MTQLFMAIQSIAPLWQSDGWLSVNPYVLPLQVNSRRANNRYPAVAIRARIEALIRVARNLLSVNRSGGLGRVSHNLRGVVESNLRLLTCDLYRSTAGSWILPFHAQIVIVVQQLFVQ